jgi:hypothetical protein
MKTILAVGCSLLGFVVTCHSKGSKDVWAVAESQIRQLAPTAFAELPKQIMLELQSRGCTVPQVYGAPKPHNVIRGEFQRKGQVDWAVLCSRNGLSSVLVF